MSERCALIDKEFGISMTRDRLMRFYRLSNITWRVTSYTWRTTQEKEEIRLRDRKKVAGLLQRAKEKGTPILYVDETR